MRNMCRKKSNETSVLGQHFSFDEDRVSSGFPSIYQTSNQMLRLDRQDGTKTAQLKEMPPNIDDRMERRFAQEKDMEQLKRDNNSLVLESAYLRKDKKNSDKRISQQATLILRLQEQLKDLLENSKLSDNTQLLREQLRTYHEDFDLEKKERLKLKQENLAFSTELKEVRKTIEIQEKKLLLYSDLFANPMQHHLNLCPIKSSTEGMKKSLSTPTSPQFLKEPCASKHQISYEYKTPACHRCTHKSANNYYYNHHRHLSDDYCNDRFDVRTSQGKLDRLSSYDSISTGITSLSLDTDISAASKKISKSRVLDDLTHSSEDFVSKGYDKYL